MSNDPELTAMTALADALNGLEDDARARVLRWAADRFGVTLGKPARGLNRDDTGEEGEWEDLASLFIAANPSTDAEKVLVGGYWFQVVEGFSDLEGGTINTELKHLGHGVSNITRAFDDLKSRKPALAIQTQKSGKSKQARKKYKITNEGIKHVKKMLSGANEVADEGDE